MIPVERAHLKVSAKTHEGMSGKNNEDQFAVTAYELSSTDPTPSLFAIVADGIGGHQAGEVASEIAVDMISQAVAESDGSQPTAIMQAAAIQASQTILAQSESDPDKAGMGTTVTCAWIIGDRLYAISVGNSRLYLLRDGVLRQISVDHTWVQEAYEAGVLTKDQIRDHPNSNIIRRHLGSSRPVEVDLRIRMREEQNDKDAEANQGMRLLPGDLLLINSDGLHDMISDEEIDATLKAHKDLGKAAQELIDKANAAGGKDNITVALLEMADSKTENDSETQPRRRKRRPSCLVMSLVAIIVGLLVAVGAWYFLVFQPGVVEPLPTLTATPIPSATFTLEPSETATPTLEPSPTVTDTPAPTGTNTLDPEQVPAVIEPSPTATDTPIG